ncbi:DinB family protein [Peribacillus frigoritolerans]|nr:DinB family protein [Peribacillus frigoritolerans]
MVVLSKEGLLNILEGNRRLTLRVVEAFPEEELFHYTPAGKLRPFAEMVKEVMNIETGYMRGIALGIWEFPDSFSVISTKEDLVSACEAVRDETRKLWEEMTDETLGVVEKDPFSVPHKATLIDFNMPWKMRSTIGDRVIFILERLELNHRNFS